MSDTPRTDKAPWTFTEADLNSKRKQRWVKIEFARELERENAALKAALDHQMSYQRELRADKARLDWLDEKGCWLTIPAQRNFISGAARAVIDAAMQEAKQ